MSAKKGYLVLTAAMVAGLSTASVLAHTDDAGGPSMAELVAQIAAVTESIVQVEARIETLTDDLERIHEMIDTLSEGDTQEDQLTVHASYVAFLQAQARRIERQIDADVEQLNQLRDTKQRLQRLLMRLYGKITTAGPNPDRV